MATTMLRLARKWRAIDEYQEWKVELDGDIVGSIANGQAVDLPVDPGQHTLRLWSVRSLGSRERSFEAAAGDVISFSCYARLMWHQALIAQVRNDLWIGLKQT